MVQYGKSIDGTDHIIEVVNVSYDSSIPHPKMQTMHGALDQNISSIIQVNVYVEFAACVSGQTMFTRGGRESRGAEAIELSKSHVAPLSELMETEISDVSPSNM